MTDDDADVVQMLQMGMQMRDTANVYGQEAPPTVHNVTGPYFLDAILTVGCRDGRNILCRNQYQKPPQLEAGT